jgi:hypothetical protein
MRRLPLAASPPLATLLLSTLALAACNDAGLTKFNAAPVANITSHGPDDDGDNPQLLEGAITEFTGKVSDPDDSAETLITTWYLGEEQICETAVATASGGTSCTERVDLSSDRIRLVVSDPENATETASVNLDIIPTEAPDALISSPLEIDRHYADVRITFEGLVEDVEDAETDLIVTWESDLDGVINAANEPDDAGGLIGRANLTEGEHLITLHVEDTHGKTGTDNVAITVGPANRTPDCSIHRPADGSVWTHGETVTFEGLATDLDVGPDELDASWRSDIDGLLDVSNPALTGELLFDATTLSKGTHTITLTVADDVEATCIDSMQIIVDTPPDVEITAPVDGTENNEDVPHAFTATVFDEQDAAPALTLVWESDVDGTFSTDPAAVDGTVSLPEVSLSVGQHIITLTATDTVGLTSSASISVEVNGLPTAPVVSIDPDPPGSGDDLTATIDTASTDPDGDAITYAYSWTVDTTATAHATAVIAAADTLKDEVWEVTVTPDDGVGVGPSATASVTIGNGAPVVATGAVTPTSPTTNETLTVAATATDPDGDTTTLRYEWFVNGFSTGQTGTTLDGASYFDRSDSVTVEIIANDGDDDSAVFTSTGVTVVNTAPGTPGISVTPAAPRSSNDDIVCEIATVAPDDDADALTYVFSWTVDSVAFTSVTDTATTSTVDASDIGIGEVWECTVYADDGTDVGPSVSASVTSVKGFNGWSSTTVSLGDSDNMFVGEDLSDYVGWAVAGPGDVDGDGYPDLMMGGYNSADGSTRTGMAFIIAAGSLSASASIDLADADWRFIGEDAADQAGKSVSGAGDVDGDGVADLLVGGPNIDDGVTNAGGVYLILGAELGTTPDIYLYDAQALLVGEETGDRVGETISTAGDVDGDGLDDLVIGAWSNDDAGLGAGKTYLILGASSVTGTTSLADADLAWTGEAAGDASGASVAGVTATQSGDIDGDGLDDLLIGAWGNDDGGSAAGKAYVVLSSAMPASGAPLSSASVGLIGEGANDFAGYSVAIPGDVDGDGAADLVVGAYGDSPSGSRSGRSYLVYASTISGASTLDLSSADHRYAGEAVSDLSGIRVSGAGDVDNDGLADFLVGAPANDTGGSNSGTVYLVLAENIPTTRNIGLSTIDYGFTGEDSGDQAGYGMAAAGDVDGDGFDDMLIGAYGSNDGGTDAGKVYLMLSP